MKGPVVIAALSVVVLVGLAVFVRSRGDAPAPAVPVDAAEVADVERPVTRARPAVALPLEMAPDVATNEPTVTNLYARFRDGDFPHVSSEQLDPYLAKHHRSVDALLGALRASAHLRNYSVSGDGKV